MRHFSGNMPFVDGVLLLHLPSSDGVHPTVSDQLSVGNEAVLVCMWAGQRASSWSAECQDGEMAPTDLPSLHAGSVPERDGAEAKGGVLSLNSCLPSVQDFFLLAPPEVHALPAWLTC